MAFNPKWSDVATVRKLVDQALWDIETEAGLSFWAEQARMLDSPEWELDRLMPASRNRKRSKQPCAGRLGNSPD